LSQSKNPEIASGEPLRGVGIFVGGAYQPEPRPSIKSIATTLAAR
jgi:hypothetical protein